jgi:glycosyltransferase involved in cell wall biosynthesis
MSTRASILFLEKVFLKRREAPARGVEIFNLNLVRDMASLGAAVTVPAHASWAEDLRKCGETEIRTVRLGGGPVIAGLAGVLSLASRRFDALLLGNVATGLIPAIGFVRLARLARRAVLIAHREPHPRFLRAQVRMPTSVVAVNRVIADEFRAAGFPDTKVSYGVTDAERFYPGTPRSRTDGVVRFCVVGQLESAWKGSDWALEAFAGLPPALAGRCELHLASYRNPPAGLPRGAHARAWMPLAEMSAFLREMDVMLVPSRDEHVMRETFCQAMVQGMLTGLPVAVNDLPVLTEKLDRGGGLVFKDVAGLRAAMETLAADPALRARLGAEGRATAQERYIWRTGDFLQTYFGMR